MALTEVHTAPQAGAEVDLVERWPARRRLATAAGAAWYVAHIGVSLAVTSFVAHAIPPPAQTPAILVWLAGMAATAAVSLEVSQRAARRLLTLRALLGLSLAFPDAAPSRFAIALRSGNPRRLQDRLDDLDTTGLGATPDVAAVALLELVAALSAHDRSTRGHSERVRAYTELIAEELELDRSACEALRWGGLIHDVGKLRVPAEILNKHGALAEGEWEIIRRHPADGARLAAPMSAWLGEWALAVLDHHERWDGTGYPRGLAGSDISLAGRIVAVADAFDVMTSARSYQKPRPQHEARAELVRCAGTQFDPIVVRAFLNLSVRKVRGVLGPLAWIAHWPLFEWRVLRVARRVAPATALVLVTGVAAVTAPPSGATEPAAGTEIVAPDGGSSAAATPDGASPGGDHGGGSTTALDDGSSGTGFGGPFGVFSNGGTHPDPDGGARSALPVAPSGDMGTQDADGDDPDGADGGGGGGGGGGDAQPTTITIDPSEGSVAVEDVGQSDHDLPVIAFTPAGVLLCDNAGVCQPIVVPLPLP